MKDIVPYEPEVAKRLGVLLAKMGVLTFSPTIGLSLLQVVESLDKLLLDLKGQKDKDPAVVVSMQALLQGYRHRILDICNVAGAQQGEEIRKLEQLIKGR